MSDKPINELAVIRGFLVDAYGNYKTPEAKQAFATIRQALERQRLPEWVGTDGIITERLRQMTGFEGEASIPQVLEEMEKLQRLPDGWQAVPVKLNDDMVEAIASNKHKRLRHPERNVGLIQAIYDDWAVALGAAPKPEGTGT